jgi:hypothetical protein
LDVRKPWCGDALPGMSPTAQAPAPHAHNDTATEPTRLQDGIDPMTIHQTRAVSLGAVQKFRQFGQHQGNVSTAAWDGRGPRHPPMTGTPCGR